MCKSKQQPNIDEEPQQVTISKCAMWWFLGLTIVSVILSVVAVCRCSPTAANLDFDYMGVIVAVLSLIVAVLLGWNIYSVINFNEKTKEVKRLNYQSQKAVEQCKMANDAVKNLEAKIQESNKTYEELTSKLESTEENMNQGFLNSAYDPIYYIRFAESDDWNEKFFCMVRIYVRCLYLSNIAKVDESSQGLFDSLYKEVVTDYKVQRLPLYEKDAATLLEMLDIIKADGFYNDDEKFKQVYDKIKEATVKL